MFSSDLFDDIILLALFVFIILILAGIIYLIRERIKDDDPTKGIF